MFMQCFVIAYQASWEFVAATPSPFIVGVGWGNLLFTFSSSGSQAPECHLHLLSLRAIFWDKRILAKYVRAKNVSRTNCYCLK